MKNLAKTRSVFLRVSISGLEDFQLFERAVDEEPDDYHVFELKIPTVMWKDMGEPETITVTVEPGDKLNEA